ncbi:MAG: hypothetical protein J2P50_18600 [Hyphomicrobiaceae bacterium]|nr:hypothetical protein [Hyphomicrobiaceae bacterium]
MAQQQINSKHQKVAGKSTGENAEFKRDGYARGPVPPSMIGTKVGLTNHEGYSGPDVVQGTHNG